MCYEVTVPPVTRMVTYITYIHSFTGIVEPVSYGQDAKDYLSRTINNTLVKGLTELCKKKPEEPIVSMTQYLDLINRERIRVNCLIEIRDK